MGESNRKWLVEIELVICFVCIIKINNWVIEIYLYFIMLFCKFREKYIYIKVRVFVLGVGCEKSLW